jgi:hypothetical protein
MDLESAARCPNVVWGKNPGCQRFSTFLYASAVGSLVTCEVSVQ